MMKWNALFNWTGEKIHQFADKYWPQPAKNLSALQKANDLVTEHANKVLLVEAELENSRASIAELTNKLEESRTSLADKNQELAQLSERSEALAVEVKGLEEERDEDIRFIFDLRRMVIQYFIDKQSWVEKIFATRRFNKSLREGFEITDEEIRDQEQNIDPEEAFERLKTRISQQSTDPA